MESGSVHSIVLSILSTDVKPTKSVICSILAFLEAIEEDLNNPAGACALRVVQQREVRANGIVGQGRRVPQHVAKFGLPTENFTGDLSGRKTPQVTVIIPRLVEYLDSQGFDASSPTIKTQLLHAVSEQFRSLLGLSLGAMRITPAGMSAAAVIEEILRQAEARGLNSAIAELLVGSKLEVCLGSPHKSKIAAQHKWENGRDDPDALGDYRIENVAIEVDHGTRPGRNTSCEGKPNHCKRNPGMLADRPK